MGKFGLVDAIWHSNFHLSGCGVFKGKETRVCQRNGNTFTLNNYYDTHDSTLFKLWMKYREIKRKTARDVWPRWRTRDIAWNLASCVFIRALKRMGGETSACLLCDAWCGVRLGRERLTRNKSKMAPKSGVGDKQLIRSLDEDLSDESCEASHWWKKPKLPR